MPITTRRAVLRWLASALSLPAAAVGMVVGGCDSRAGSRGPAGAAPSRGPRVVRVAAAADLKFALDEVIARFHAATPGITVTPTYGSSGTFYAQLTNRAPFDLFFSADVDYPRRLGEAGLTLPGSQFDYAIGRIVVWVRSDSPLDVAALGIDALTHPSARRVAIANPDHAPYGRAALAALMSLGVHQRVMDRLVLGENIAQTAQFVESGAADIGIIALSLALAPALRDRGRYWTIPADAHPALEQAGVIMAWAKDPEATERFRAFVTGPDGRAVLTRFGFVLPGE